MTGRQTSAESVLGTNHTSPCGVTYSLLSLNLSIFPLSSFIGILLTYKVRPLNLNSIFITISHMNTTPLNLFFRCGKSLHY